MLQFKPSQFCSLGMELEIQIINRENNNLAASIEEILHLLKKGEFSKNIKPEITQGMLEINTGVHSNAKNLFEELQRLRNYLNTHTEKLNLFLAGGGAHPFQLWNEQELYPKKSYRIVEKKYGYLTKMYTVFGMHVHIGCENGNDALYLTHALAKHIPQLIALSASSPFCQGIDTQFDSSRSNVVNLFPLSGTAPFILEWEEFCHYFEKMEKLPWVESMNNFYWDIRPRPEYGSIEIRVCDTPLTIEKAAAIGAFVQSLSSYLLTEKPYELTYDKYHLYRYNRFQASKYGFAASLVKVKNFSEYILRDDLIETFAVIKNYTEKLESTAFLEELQQDVEKNQNDAAWLRKVHAESESLKNIVGLAGHLWSGKIKTNHC